VLLELGVLLEHRVDVADRELVVVRHVHVVHLVLPEQLLLADQHVLQEVLVDDGLVGQVVLDCGKREG